jgi:hypothetical protein
VPLPDQKSRCGQVVNSEQELCRDLDERDEGAIGTLADRQLGT